MANISLVRIYSPSRASSVSQSNIVHVYAERQKLYKYTWYLWWNTNTHTSHTQLAPGSIRICVRLRERATCAPLIGLHILIGNCEHCISKTHSTEKLELYTDTVQKKMLFPKASVWQTGGKFDAYTISRPGEDRPTTAMMMLNDGLATLLRRLTCAMCVCAFRCAN